MICALFGVLQFTMLHRTICYTAYYKREGKRTSSSPPTKAERISTRLLLLAGRTRFERKEFVIAKRLQSKTLVHSANKSRTHSARLLLLAERATFERYFLLCCTFMDSDVYSADASGSIPTLLTINILAL